MCRLRIQHLKVLVLGRLGDRRVNRLGLRVEDASPLALPTVRLAVVAVVVGGVPEVELEAAARLELDALPLLRLSLSDRCSRRCDRRRGLSDSDRGRASSRRLLRRRRALAPSLHLILLLLADDPLGLLSRRRNRRLGSRLHRRLRALVLLGEADASRRHLGLLRDRPAAEARQNGLRRPGVQLRVLLLQRRAELRALLAQLLLAQNARLVDDRADAAGEENPGVRRLGRRRGVTRLGRLLRLARLPSGHRGRHCAALLDQALQALQLAHDALVLARAQGDAHLLVCVVVCYCLFRTAKIQGGRGNQFFFQVECLWWAQSCSGGSLSKTLSI